MKKLSKKEAEETIKEFFSNIKNKTPLEVRKIKKLSMRCSLKLGELRKEFCKKCLTPYSGEEKIGVKDKKKSVACKKCNYINRWKIKLS